MTALLVLLLAPPAQAGWREDVDAAVAACAADPAPCEVAASIHLRTTRAGHLFAQDPRLTEAAVPALLARLEKETDPAIRGGLADAIVEALSGSTDPRWLSAWAELSASDRDANVRSVLLTGLRRGPAEAAGPGLRAALTHPDPVTRADAARTMGGRSDATAFVPDLVAALSDAAPSVRAAAVRALGWAGDRSAADAVRGRLSDASEEVRAEAERALARLAG